MLVAFLVSVDCVLYPSEGPETFGRVYTVIYIWLGWLDSILSDLVSLLI